MTGKRTTSRTRALLAVAVMLGGGLSQGAASAAPAQTAPLPALAGITTISGSTTGYVRVTLPRQAVLGEQFAPSARDVQITGGGRFAAFALVKEGSSGVAIVGGHTARTAALARANGEFVNGLNTGSEGRRVLPKGTYRLYLIGDNKPTTVRLRLQGLTGSRRLVPQVRARYLGQGGGGQNRPGSSPTGNVHSEGYDTVLSGRSLHFQVLATTASPSAGISNWLCLFDHKPVGPNPYLPGCASLGGASFADHFPDTGGGPGDITSVIYGAVMTARGGPVGSGAAVATIGPSAKVAYDHFWLGL